MSALSQTAMGDSGEDLLNQIVAAMQNHPIFGGDCDEPVYLLRYTDNNGVEQFQKDTETFWTSAITTSCHTVQKVIGYPIQPWLHNNLWVLKVNPNFFFEDKDTFRDSNFSIRRAECHWKGPGCEVIFYGTIPDQFLYVQPFTIGTDCQW